MGGDRSDRGKGKISCMGLVGIVVVMWGDCMIMLLRIGLGGVGGC